MVDFGSALTQAFNTFKTLPQQFQAIPELIRPTIRKATLPIAQIAEGIGQRINYPRLASPVSPIERSLFQAQQNLVNQGALERGSDYYIDRQPTQQDTMAERFSANTYPGMEKTESAFMYPSGHAVATTPALEQARNQTLRSFSPLAQFQLQGVPVGIQPPLWGGGGTAFVEPKTKFDKSITVTENLYPRDVYHVMAHEVLHAAARGKGGIPWDDFIRDFTAYSIQNPAITAHFNQLDEAHRTGPEEIYAEIGALLGPNIFNTPLGKYYEGIIEKPKKVLLRRKVK